MKKLIALALTSLCLTFTTCAFDHKCSMKTPVVRVIEETEAADETEIIEEEPDIVEETEPVTEAIETEPEIFEEELLSQEEIELIVLVTMAEAEGEPVEGKRLVIDVILNRMDHDRFPDTVHDVVYQRNQFTSMSNGRVDRCRVTKDIYDLVVEELKNRTNHDVIFFTANEYGIYDAPMFSVANHYFSSYS